MQLNLRCLHGSLSLHRQRNSYPVLPFLFLFGKGKEHHPPQKIIPTKPLNPWKRRKKRSQKQGFPRMGKKQRLRLLKKGKEGQGAPRSESVKCRFRLVLSSKTWKNVRDGGQRRKINPESLASIFSLCRHAGIDAA